MRCVIGKISIIVPIYNSEKYLARCIESILRQTYSNLEIILVDDGSVDDSAHICDSFAFRDERILVFHQPNGGVSVARNLGLKKAKGDFVMFVDADDWMEPDLCEILISSMDEKCDLVICGYWDVYKNSRCECKPSHLVRVQNQHFGKDFSTIYHHSAFNPPWAKLFRRDVIRELSFEPGREIGEDLLFNLDYMEHCRGDLLFLPYSGYYYNEANSESAMHSFRKEDFEQKNYFYHKMLRFREIFHISPEDSIGIEQQLYMDGIGYLQLLYAEGYPRQGEKQLAKACLNNVDFHFCCSLDYGGRLDQKFQQFLCAKKMESVLRIFCRIKRYIRMMIPK